MMKKLLAAVLAALCLPVAVHAQSQPESWTPKGQWTADYGDDYCRLVRFFANGTDEIALIMERVQPGASFRLLIIGDAIKLYRGATQVEYRLMPGGESRKTFLLRSKTPDGKQYLDYGAISLAPMPLPAKAEEPPVFKPYRAAEERALAKSVTGVELTSGVLVPVQIATGALDAPVGALQACVNDLIAQWGVDAKRHQTLSRPVLPQGDMANWLPKGTYPFTEFAKLSGGLNSIRLSVDETGKPTACVVQRPTVEERMNNAACAALLKNAQFQPALDSEGQALASYWVSEVMPLLGPPPRAMGRR